MISLHWDRPSPWQWQCQRVYMIFLQYIFENQVKIFLDSWIIWAAGSTISMKCIGARFEVAVTRANQCWVITDHLSRGGRGWSRAPARPPLSLDPVLADGVRVSECQHCTGHQWSAPGGYQWHGPMKPETGARIPGARRSSRHICLPVIPAGCVSSWSLLPLVYVSQVSHLLLHIPRVPWPSAWTHLPLWRPAHIIADLNLDVHWALLGVKFVILYSSLFASVFCYHKQQSVDCLVQSLL